MSEGIRYYQCHTRNISGPMTVPCGTPERTSESGDVDPSMTPPC